MEQMAPKAGRGGAPCRTNQTVTDRAAGKTDHREGVCGEAECHDVCSGVPIGLR